MFSITRRTLFYVAGLLLVLAGTATLGSAQVIQNATAQPGDIICLAPQTVPLFQALQINGNAFIPNSNPPVPVTVKWIAFDAGTTPNTRVVNITASQVPPSTFAKGNGDQFYACINNNSG